MTRGDGLEAVVRSELARRHGGLEQLRGGRQLRARRQLRGGRRNQAQGARGPSRAAMVPSVVERGLTDGARDASAAASTPLAAASRPARGATAAAVVRCDRCGLVVASRTAALVPRYCPRCLARRRLAVHLQPFQIAPGEDVARARLELQLPASEEAPEIARRRVVERFAAELDRRELENARLLTSELVTNAIVHGSGAIELSAALDEDRLFVSVTDHGEGFEWIMRKHDPDAIGGNGLNIVDAVASRWGIHEGSSHVWFELERPGPRLGPDAETEQLSTAAHRT